MSNRKKTFLEGNANATAGKRLRRVDDQHREQLLRDRDRKLRSLLELGQLIGLDLKIDGYSFKSQRRRPSDGR